MNTITLFSRPYRNSQGQLFQSSIQFSALRGSEFYDGYCYGRTHVSADPHELQPDRYTHDSSFAEEYLTRSRRSAAFADALRAKPIAEPTEGHRQLLKQVEGCLHADHVTCWILGDDTPFLLVEPYCDDFGRKITLSQLGLLCCTVPQQLSPYCGDWNSALGASPKTTSFLLGFSADQAALTRAEKSLQVGAIWTPRWNATVGIQHVQLG